MQTPPTPQTNPDFVSIEDNPALPRVLLIGDSISMGYTLPTRAHLTGRANVHRPPVNCGPTTRGLSELDSWLGEDRWDVIHFNFGLHDLKYADDEGVLVPVSEGKQLVSLADYEANLRSIVERLRATGAQVIWATTTPVPSGANGRIEGSEAAYNEVAARVVQDNDIPVDDLHGVVVAHPEGQLPRDVHFTTEGYEQLARAVVASIEAALPEKES